MQILSEDMGRCGFGVPEYPGGRVPAMHGNCKKNNIIRFAGLVGVRFIMINNATW